MLANRSRVDMLRNSNELRIALRMTGHSLSSRLIRLSMQYWPALLSAASS